MQTTTNEADITYHCPRRMLAHYDAFYMAENAAGDETFTFPSEAYCENIGVDPWTDVSAHLSLAEAAKQLANEVVTR